jgi:hypothetical protein
VTEGVDAFKMFFKQEVIETIVRETNIYALHCIQSRGITLPLLSRTRYWKPVTEDENICCSGNFHAHGHSSKAHSTIIFSKKSLLATLVFRCVISSGLTTQSSTIKVKSNSFLKTSVHN